MISHACRRSVEVAESIFKTGFANLKTTDNGFYGSGFYFTPDLKYALEHYAKPDKDGVRALLVCDVVVGNVYPVIESAAEDAADTLRNCDLVPCYDAHVVAVHPGPPCEVCHPGNETKSRPVYTEIVVRENAAVLPRFILLFKDHVPTTVAATTTGAQAPGHSL